MPSQSPLLPSVSRSAFLTFLSLALFGVAAISCTGETAASRPEITTTPPTQMPQATAAVGPDGTRPVYPTQVILGNEPFNIRPVVQPSEALMANVTVLGRHDAPLDDWITAMTVVPGTQDSAAFIAAGKNIYLTDISDPDNIELGRLVGTAEQEIVNLDASENTLVALSGEELWGWEGGDAEIFQIGDDFGIEHVATLRGMFRSAQVAGEFLYLTSYEHGFQVYLLEPGAVPQLIGSVASWGTPVEPYEANAYAIQDAYVDGDTAYLAAGLSGIGIFDVSQPWAPQPLSVLDPSTDSVPGYFAGVIAADGPTLLVTEDGDYAYRGHIFRIDVSDPGSPRVTGDTYERVQHGGFRSLRVIDDTGYFLKWVGDWISSWTLGVLDLSDPDDIEITGRLIQNGLPGKLAATGDRFFVPETSSIATIDPGLVNGDLGEGMGGAIPEAVTGRWMAGAGPDLVRLTDEHAFVFAHRGVHVYDIRTPGRVVPVAEMQLNGRGPVGVEDNMALFFKSRSNEAQTEIYSRLDLSDPSLQTWANDLVRPSPREGRPSAAEECPLTGIADVCYRINSINGEGQIALRTSEAINRGKEYPEVLVPDSESSYGSELVSGNGHIFVVNGADICIYSAEDPHEPLLVTKQSLAIQVEAYGTRSRIWFDGDRVFVIADGLWVFDVSTPAEPEVVAYHQSDAVEIGVSGDTVALVDVYGNVEVVRIVR